VAQASLKDVGFGSANVNQEVNPVGEGVLQIAGSDGANQVI
jgi:hypothetical protein